MATYPAPYPAAQPAAAYASAPAADPYAAAQAQAYAQPPVAAYAPVAPTYPTYTAYPSNPDEVRTIFITGFPADMKERELNNLLRFVPGYEASQINWRNSQAQGFALFQHGQAARDAINLVHNLQFDADCNLRCEMARKNMYIREDPSIKRSRYEQQPYGTAGAYGQPAAAATYAGYGGAPRASTYAPITNTRDNPPCNTLFIGNLGETVNEAELRSLFGSQPGFCQLKLNRGPGNITCFVEFADVNSAMAVHTAQQGAILNSSDRGGIRIQFSKNPYGKKRDVTGNYISTPVSQSTYSATGEETAATTQTLSAPGVEPSESHITGA